MTCVEASGDIMIRSDTPKFENIEALRLWFRYRKGSTHG